MVNNNISKLINSISHILISFLFRLIECDYAMITCTLLLMLIIISAQVLKHA